MSTNNADLLKRAIEAVSVRRVIEKFGRAADIPERDNVKFSSVLRADKHPSCSINDNKYHDWSYELHLDSYDLYQRLSGLDSKAAFVPFVQISPYAHELNGNGSHSFKNSSFNKLDWSALAKSIGEQDLQELAKSRGYTEEFCKWLVDSEYIGRKGSSWAFPVVHDQKVVSTHIRLDKNKWTYEPPLSELGVNLTPLIVGELTTAEFIVIGESQWDVFACLDALGIYRGEKAAGVATRGATNGHKLSTVKLNGTAIFIPQNDTPGRQWLEKAKASVTAPYKILVVPENYHDANDWWLDAGDLAGAIEQAPAEPAPDKVVSEREAETDSFEWLRPQKTSTLTSEQPDQILRGILYKGCKGILTGGSKSFKTWTLLDVAFCVGNGLHWWGTHTLKCPVLYLDFELLDYDFRWRMEQIAEAHGEGAVDAVERIGLRSRRLNTKHWSEIYRYVVESGAGLVVADPTYKLLPPHGDENAAGTIAEVAHLFDLLSEETGAAIVFAQHFSKGNQAQKESIDRAAGSGVWARDADAIICMTKHAEGEDCLTVETTLRSFPRIDPFVVRWSFPLFERAIDLNPADLKQPAKLGGSVIRYSVDDLVKCLGSKDLKTAEFQKLVRTETGMSNGKFYDLLKAGQDKGTLHKSEVDGKWEVVRK
jgi:hypothetical protein